MKPSNSPLDDRQRFSRLQLVIMFLSIYVVVELFLKAVIDVSPETDAWLDRIDFLVCLVFLGDFFVRLARAPSKRQFLKWGWIDFITSVPMFGAFRSVRAVKILRILRVFRSFKLLLRYAIRCGKISPLGTVAIVSVVLVFFSSYAIFQFEKSPDSNIKTPMDAVWWAYVTITTVGYGDKYPVTFEGRVVAVFLMTAGVGLFGALSGFVASLFIGTDIRKEDDDIVTLTREIQSLRTHLAVIEAKLDERNSGL